MSTIRGAMGLPLGGRVEAAMEASYMSLVNSANSGKTVLVLRRFGAVVDDERFDGPTV